MKKILQLLLISLSIFILPCANAASAVSASVVSPSPIGYWKTIDDVTGKPKSILHIYQSGNVLYGQVVKIYPRPGFDQNELCTACKGMNHNHRIVGMIVMQGLKQSSSNPMEWSGGKILDPLNGKMYSCTITLLNGGHNLNVRGYIGFTLFGRTQTWVRISSAK